ncbi:monoacylglycerol lipase abhd6-A-like [Dendronephthya gigantea]|uniref:monoacylglycerol lipase abhd6-A-like n=1 Tax=Dendronephthya gigantea TaxID=151771 RepID=UPI00106C5341|nr:monoacylglycerol lipase abhd6-A-like [Dendronephthya gigantea]
MLGDNTGVSFLLLLVSKLALILLSLAYIYYFQTVWIIRMWTRYRVWRACLKKHRLKITDDLEISYLERKAAADANVLLFVHGFTGDKEIYSDLIRFLPTKFHIIAIDLPGHGESKPNDAQSDYKPSTMVDYLHKFVKAYGFGERKLNLIGSSMGGSIVGMYAAKYGDESLASAVLLCPSGIHSPEVTEFLLKSRDDLQKNVLLPKTPEDFDEMIKLVMHHKINIPSHIAMAFVSIKKLKADIYKKVLSDMRTNGEYLMLDKVLEEIQNPVLCVWGEHDKILHVSGSDVIKQRVKNAEVHVLDKCGHAITLDRPRKLVKIITQFLNKIA